MDRKFQFILWSNSNKSLMRNNKNPNLSIPNLLKLYLKCMKKRPFQTPNNKTSLRLKIINKKYQIFSIMLSLTEWKEEPISQVFNLHCSTSIWQNIKKPNKFFTKLCTFYCMNKWVHRLKKREKSQTIYSSKRLMVNNSGS